MNENRALLDSLMGEDRNSLACKPNRRSFKDRDVCHYYLLNFCPHDLFPNTRSDLGPCPKSHSNSLREQFIGHPDHDHFRDIYEREFIDELTRLVNAVEQRIRRGNERILGPDEQQVEKEKIEKSEKIKAEIAGLLDKAQKAGEAGNISQAEQLTRQADELRRQVEGLLTITVSRSMPGVTAQEKSLRVCSTCGAMQSLGDAASRFESHIAGKQHVGYERIRIELAALKQKHDAKGNNTKALNKENEPPAAASNHDGNERPRNNRNVDHRESTRRGGGRQPHPYRSRSRSYTNYRPYSRSSSGHLPYDGYRDSRRRIMTRDSPSPLRQRSRNSDRKYSDDEYRGRNDS